MGSLEIDVKEIRKLVELVDTHGLEELTVQEADFCVTVKGRSSVPVVLQGAVAPAVPAVAAALVAHEDAPVAAAPEPAAEQTSNLIDIVAPLVGVFYRSPAPDAPPFVDVGDIIEVGTEVGLIEAMKVFSSIPSEVAGTVVSVPAPNGKLVHEGDVLIRVQPAEEHPDQ